MEYKRVALADVCDFVAGFAFKSKDFGDYDAQVIKITHITPPVVDMDNLAGVDLTKYNPEKLKKYVAEKGDYVLAMTGATIGKIGRIEKGSAYINQRVLLFKSRDSIDKDYLYYVLLQYAFEQYILSHIDSQSAQPNISAGTIGKYSFHLPDLNTQKKVGSFLRTLDARCELNRQINDNLQQQMAVLYNSWFVKYEPFGGSCPQEWKKSDIYSIADIIYGAPFASKLFNTAGEGKPIIRIRDLKAQQFTTYTTEHHPKGYLLQHGDIVVGMDGEFRPYIWANDEAWLNQRVCVFANKRQHGKAFLYYTIKPLLYRIEQTQVATTVIHIGKKDYDAFQLILPSSDVLDQFDAITAPMIDRIISNGLENMRLVEIRNALLSKLMSGEIDVSEIDI